METGGQRIFPTFQQIGDNLSNTGTSIVNSLPNKNELTKALRDPEFYSDVGLRAKNMFTSMHPMDQVALTTAPFPILGDVTGLAADARMFSQEPESRTPLNFGLSALGALPFIPAAATIKAFHGTPRIKSEQVRERKPIKAYHGTNSDIKKFDDAMRGSSTKANSAKKAHWFVGDPKTAEGYADYAAKDAPVQKLIDQSYAAERANKWDDANDLMRQAEELEQHLIDSPNAGQNIVPVNLDETKLMNVDAEGQNWSQLDDNQVSDWLAEAKESGYQGLQIDNFSDEARYGIDNPQTHYAIFDAENINSQFDPIDDIVNKHNAALDSVR